MINPLFDHFEKAFVDQSRGIGYMLVFPDRGAKDRFLPIIQRRFSKDGGNKMPPYIVMNKVRHGDERKVMVDDRVPGWFVPNKQTAIVIFDDLVQSGRTIVEVASLLASEGYTHINASCVHAVFPTKESYMNFTQGGLYEGKIRRFFLTNTNPQRTSVLQDLDPFRVIDVSKHVLSSMGMYLEEAGAYTVASTNPDKMLAVAMYVDPTIDPKEVVDSFWRQSVKGYPSESYVPAQPFGFEETNTGCLNRLKGLPRYVPSHITNGSICCDELVRVAIENGIVDGCDTAVVNVVVNNRPGFGSSEKIPVDPAVIDEAKETGTTVGSVMAAKHGCDKSNWHIVVSGVNRSYLMYEVLEKAARRVGPTVYTDEVDPEMSSNISELV